MWEKDLGPCTNCGAIYPVKALINIIKNPEPSQTERKVIEKVAQKLKFVLSDQILESLIELLSNDSCNVRKNAAQALEVIGDSKAVSPLIEFIRKPYDDESVRYYYFGGGGRTSAIRALRTLAGMEAVPILIASLADTSWGVRNAAAEALCELRDKRAVSALKNLVLPIKIASQESEESRARAWALRSLQKIVGDEILEWCKSPTELHTWLACTCTSCGTTLHKWKDGKCIGCGLIHRHYDDNTDLHQAIYKDGNLSEIRNLCLNGLINIGDEEGFTPLMKAAGPYGSLAIVKLLVELGADIHAHSSQGTTALSMAALHNKQDVYDFLIDHGAKVDFILRNIN